MSFILSFSQILLWLLVLSHIVFTHRLVLFIFSSCNVVWYWFPIVVFSQACEEEGRTHRFQSDEAFAETQTHVRHFFFKHLLKDLIPHFCFKPRLFSRCRETETSRFRDAVKALSAKTNPLLDIGEHLRKRMRQEEEQGQTWWDDKMGLWQKTHMNLNCIYTKPWLFV